VGQPGDKGAVIAPRSSTKSNIDEFLEAAAKLPATSGSGRGRLIFALDATMSRQATWDMAQSVQGRMFATAAEHGGLDVQLVYYRGFSECKASRFVAGGQSLASLMTKIGLAAEIGLLGVKAFLFQEGRDSIAEQAFRKIALLTGGAYATFDLSSPERLVALLTAAAAYAAGGRRALEFEARAHGAAAADHLLSQMR
jgi:hypothetical protein